MMKKQSRLGLRLCGRSLVAFLPLWLFYGCESKEKVKVPASDSSPPSVSMSVNFGRPGALQNIQLNGQSATPAIVHLTNVGDELAVIAVGRDVDGGIKDIEIQPDIQSTWTLPNGTGATSGPLSALTHNPSNAQRGQFTSIERSVSFGWEVPDPRTQTRATPGATNFRIHGTVYAQATNFDGGSAKTPVFEFIYP